MLLFTSSSAFQLYAQNEGIIEGFVKDDNGVGIGGVTLTLFNADTNTQIATYTTVNTVSNPAIYGIYGFTGLAAGNYYVVQTQPPGFDSVSEVDGGDDSDNPDNGIENNIPVTLSTNNERDTGNNFIERVPRDVPECSTGTSEVRFDWSSSAGTGNEWTADNKTDGATRTYTLNYTDAQGTAQTIDVTVTMRDPDGINIDNEFTCPTTSCDNASGFYTQTNGNFGGGFLTLAEATSSINQELTFDFEFSKPVLMKDFSVSDIDWVSYNSLNNSVVDDTYINFQDEITIVGEKGGTGVPLDYTVGSNLTLVDGNTVRSTDYYVNSDGTGVIGDVSPSYPTNAVYVSSPTEVDKLSVTFRNGDGDTLSKNGKTDPGHSNGHFVRLNSFLFCVIDYPAIGGRVTEDTTGDGEGDTGIAGVTITLQNADGTPAVKADGSPVGPITTSDGTTDVNGDGVIDPVGSYYIPGLTAGEYQIVQTQPTDYVNVKDGDTSPDGDTNSNTDIDDNIIPVTLENGKIDANNDFVEVKTGAVSGKVELDNTGDNSANEGLSGITVTLKNPDGSTATDAKGQPLTTTTSDGTTDVDGDGTIDPAGSYYFDKVMPGEYNVVETHPSQYQNIFDGDTSDDTDTRTNSSTTDDSIPVTVKPNEVDADNNFLESLPRDYGDLPATYGTISALSNPDADGDNQPDDSNSVWAGSKVDYETSQNYSGTAAGDTQDDGLTVTSKAPDTGTNRTEKWTISANSNSTTSPVYYQVNIDWDNDGTFDATYTGTITVSTAGTPETKELDIAVPDGYTGGPVNVRYVVASNATDAAKTTGTFTNGEVEDYQFNTSDLLPVSLIAFNAVQSGDDVLLTWATATEQNNEKFVVQYSIDGIDFQPLAEVTGSGNSSVRNDYSTLHVAIAKQGYNQVYYKLMQSDFDGTTKAVGNIQTVVFENTQKIIAFPVPAQQGQSVTILNAFAGVYKVFNTSGQLEFIGNSTRETLSIPTSKLAAGVYFVVFEKGNTVKFIVK